MTYMHWAKQFVLYHSQRQQPLLPDDLDRHLFPPPAVELPAGQSDTQNSTPELVASQVARKMAFTSYCEYDPVIGGRQVGQSHKTW